MASKITYNAKKSDGKSEVYIEYDASNKIETNINYYIPPVNSEDSGYHQTISVSFADLKAFVDKVNNNLVDLALEREANESSSNTRLTHRENI